MRHKTRSLKGIPEQERREIVERFQSHIHESDPGKCWYWNGVSTGNYGGFKIRGYIGAHRASYIINYGHIPPNKCVLHKCNNKRCVNPSHLYTGTRLDNKRDERTSRDLVVGPIQMCLIRALRSTGASYDYLARVFNVSVYTVRNVILRKEAYSDF